MIEDMILQAAANTIDDKFFLHWVNERVYPT